MEDLETLGSDSSSQQQHQQEQHQSEESSSTLVAAQSTLTPISSLVVETGPPIITLGPRSHWPLLPRGTQTGPRHLTPAAGVSELGLIQPSSRDLALSDLSELSYHSPGALSQQQQLASSTLVSLSTTATAATDMVSLAASSHKKKKKHGASNRSKKRKDRKKSSAQVHVQVPEAPSDVPTAMLPLLHLEEPGGRHQKVKGNSASSRVDLQEQFPDVVRTLNEFNKSVFPRHQQQQAQPYTGARGTCSSTPPLLTIPGLTGPPSARPAAPPPIPVPVGVMLPPQSTGSNEVDISRPFPLLTLAPPSEPKKRPFFPVSESASAPCSMPVCSAVSVPNSVPPASMPIQVPLRPFVPVLIPPHLLRPQQSAAAQRRPQQQQQQQQQQVPLLISHDPLSKMRRGEAGGMRLLQLPAREELPSHSSGVANTKDIGTCISDKATAETQKVITGKTQQQYQQQEGESLASGDTETVEEVLSKCQPVAASSSRSATVHIMYIFMYACAYARTCTHVHICMHPCDNSMWIVGKSKM